MIKFVVAILGTLLALTGITAAVAPPAEATVGFSYVYNGTSKVIKVACSYGGTLIELAPDRDSMDNGKCTKSRSDVDQILTTTTVKMIFSGPVKADGCYNLQPSIRAKVPDLSVTNLYNYNAGCKGKPYKGYWTYR